MTRLLGLSGKAGSGKDFFITEVLQPLGFVRWGLADHFKIGLVSQGACTFEEAFYSKPDWVRRMLQTVGTELGRNVHGEDIWVKHMLNWWTLLGSSGLTKWVCADCRFPNEVAAIERVGGIVLRLSAPEREARSPLTIEQRGHISETALDTHKFQHYINNEVGTPVIGLRHQFKIVCLSAGWMDLVSFIGEDEELVGKGMRCA